METTTGRCVPETEGNPILTRADFSKRFRLETDASDGTPRVIMYASRKLTPPETRYSTAEKECLAILWSIRKMKALHFI